MTWGASAWGDKPLGWISVAEAGATASFTGSLNTVQSLLAGQFSSAPRLSASLATTASSIYGQFSVSPQLYAALTTSTPILVGEFDVTSFVPGVLSGDVDTGSPTLDSSFYVSPKFEQSLHLSASRIAGGFASGDFTLTPVQLEELWNWYQLQATKRYVTFTQFITLKDVL